MAVRESNPEQVHRHCLASCLFSPLSLTLGWSGLQLIKAAVLCFNPRILLVYTGLSSYLNPKVDCYVWRVVCSLV